MRCSYIEIYTDNVYDLLKPPNKFGDYPLIISEDSNVINLYYSNFN